MKHSFFLRFTNIISFETVSVFLRIYYYSDFALNVTYELFELLRQLCESIFFPNLKFFRNLSHYFLSIAKAFI